MKGVDIPAMMEAISKAFILAVILPLRTLIIVLPEFIFIPFFYTLNKIFRYRYKFYTISGSEIAGILFINRVIPVFMNTQNRYWLAAVIWIIFDAFWPIGSIGSLMHVIINPISIWHRFPFVVDGIMFMDPVPFCSEKIITNRFYSNRVE